MAATVLGADGAPGGWIVAEVSGAGDALLELHSLRFVASLDQSVKRLHRDAAVLAVDMPIGLSTNGDRPADQLARKRLGPRHSTFFPTPIRSMLDFDDYISANAHSKHVGGVGLSKQAWNLLPKINEVDILWTEELASRLVEAHPETSLAAMAGAPVMSKKATADGKTERERLLGSVYAPSLQSELDELAPKWRVDALDACAIAWTASRHAQGVAEILGGDLDAMGRPMQLTI